MDLTREARLMQLWDDWRQHYRQLGLDFARVTIDGILDPASFDQAEKRILFVLKDSNDFASGSLADLLKNGPVYSMWHTVARWATALTSRRNFDEVNSYPIMTQALHQVAVINLKKVTGLANADPEVINAFASRDAELLRKQIEIIDPQIIVACGTFMPLIWLLDLPVNPANPYQEVIRTKSGIKVIRGRHPNRAPAKKSFEQLKLLQDE